MCNQCHHQELELIPELEILLRGRRTNFLHRKKMFHQPFNFDNREFETGQPGGNTKGFQSNNKPQISDTRHCLSNAFNLIPKHFEPELVSCIRTTVLSERTQFLLDISLQEKGPNWVKQLKPTVDIFKIFPTVNVSIELLHFIPVSPRNPDLLVSIKAYLEAQSQYYSSIVSELSMYKTIENGLQIPFTGLFQKAGIDPSKLTAEEYKSYIILVYTSYPQKIKNYLRKVEFTDLDKFVFDKYNLPDFHLPLIRTIAFDVFDSYWGQKRVTGINIKGHTDEQGTAAYNVELGRKRALTVQQQLQKELDNIFPNYAKSALQKIQFKVESAGKTHPISRQPELNRRVEVTLLYTTVPRLMPLNLSSVITRCINLLNTRRVSSDPQVKRELCMLQKMQLSNTDDRFVSGGQNVLDIQNKNRFPEPDQWNRVRFHLTNPNFFGNHIEDIRVLGSLDWLDDQIIQVKDKVNEILALQGGATKRSIEQLRSWLEDRVKDSKSIYNCYKGIF
jgi:OmpA family